MERYSKYREAILECLSSAKCHPTAEWIYNRLKPDFPNLNIATVYRNLSRLKQSGQIVSVGVFGGYERFDAVIMPHAHLVCRICGKVEDIGCDALPDDFVENVQKDTRFRITPTDFQFGGICEECIKNLKKEDRKG